MYFCTMGLITFIRYFDILSFTLITTSDQKVLFLDIDLSIFQRDQLHQYTTNNDRILRRKNPKYASKYKTQILKHVTKHNFFKKYNILQGKIDNGTLSQSDIFLLHEINKSIS